MSDSNVRVMMLLDELEEVLDASSKMPFSEKGIVDVEAALSIIKDIRLTLPEDLKDAAWVIQEKERIIDQAKAEYNRVIMAARDQAEYLIENDAIKKEAEKRAYALTSEAEKHSRYMKYRAYEYVDKLLYDMQNDIANVAMEYLQPMTDYFSNMISDMNAKVNGNRQEMKNLASKIQLIEEEEAEE